MFEDLVTIINYKFWDDPMLDEDKIADDVNCIMTLRGILGKALPYLYGVNECHYYDDSRAPCLYSNIYHLGPKVIRGGNKYTIYLSHLTDRVRFRIKEGNDTLFEKDFLFGDPMMVEDLE
jgi:hypothetical protein